MSSSTGSQTFTVKARRVQIIQAAIDSVNQVGYPRASIAEIARRADVAKSAIVYYFGTKDALLLHVVEHVYTELDEQLEQSIALHSEPNEQLRAYAETYLNHTDTHRGKITAGAEIVVSHRGADGVPLYLTGTDEDSARLREILTAGMDRGIFRPIPLHIAVGLIESLLDLATTELQRDLTADLTEMIPEIVTSIFRSLVFHPG